MARAVLYRHFAADPCFNMGFDEWLALQAASHPNTVFLRLYTWAVGAITLGVHQQSWRAVDWTAVGDTPVIRRVTGGRAVYHDPSELTYAVAVDTDAVDLPALRGAVAATSESLADVLTTFLRRAGMCVQYARQSSPRESEPSVLHKMPCFESFSRHEVLSGSHKVVASAQRRFGSVLLQHGSIKLNGIPIHPALTRHPGRSFCATKGESLGQARFGELAGTFVGVMSSFVGTQIRVTEDIVEGNRELEGWVHDVRKNPLAARDIFERTSKASSLLNGYWREKTGGKKPLDFPNETGIFRGYVK
ncbi:MAG: hypothetical protein AB1744_11010 [Candidatus Zixiibacteriota bacterium]